MTGHKECKVTTLDEETVTFTDKCVTRTLFLTRGHEVIRVLTDFSLPSPFSCYCVRAQYFGPKHDLPSYKFKITLGGACKHNAEFECRNGKKDGNISGRGLHVQISTCLHKGFCQYRVPIYERNFSILCLTTDPIHQGHEKRNP